MMTAATHLPTRGDLPAARTSFVGRRREIADVRERLSGARLVTLTGVGGVGKTRLAIAVAGEVRRAFPVWLVDLAALADGSRLEQTLLAALGVRDESVKAPTEKLVEYLRGKRALLVLDNCEHLLQPCAVLVDTLLQAAPNLRILATSRVTLGIAGEHVCAVPPLSTPDPERVPSAEALAQYEAVNLLVERATAQFPEFGITSENRVAVAGLCAGLDGIPLAIELAATRLRSLSPNQLLERLTDRFGLLTSGNRSALPRQRTLRALIDWSHSLCAPEEQVLWARLSVFTGGFDLEAVEGVCADATLPAERMVHLVDHLVAQSILFPDRGSGFVRYRLLETIREYGRERLAELGGQTRLRIRHRDFYQDLAERFARDWCGPGQEAKLARLRAEHGNLRAAFDSYLAEPGEGRAALRFAERLRYHWCSGGYLGEGRTWLEQALRASPEPSKERMTALWVTAWIALLQGDHTATRDRLDECQSLLHRIPDPSIQAYVTQLRGTTALFSGHMAEAICRFEEAITAHGQAGGKDVTGTLFSLFQLSAARCHSGDLVGARAASERALALGDAHEERWSRSYALWSLALVTWVRGEPGAASEVAREGLEIKRGFNDLPGAVLMIELLAWIAASRGEFRLAAQLMGGARALWAAMHTTIAAFGPDLAHHSQRCMERAASALGERSFAAALREGERRGVEGAITHALNGADATPSGTPHRAGALTRREREVAELVAQGLSNRRIAADLVVSPRTIDGHVERILAKLAFTSRAQIAAWVSGQRERDTTPDPPGQYGYPLG